MVAVDAHWLDIEHLWPVVALAADVHVCLAVNFGSSR